MNQSVTNPSNSSRRAVAAITTAVSRETWAPLPEVSTSGFPTPPRLERQNAEIGNGFEETKVEAGAIDSNDLNMFGEHCSCCGTWFGVSMPTICNCCGVTTQFRWRGCNTLNGSNGSYTGLDDTKKKGPSVVSRARQFAGRQLVGAVKRATGVNLNSLGRVVNGRKKRQRNRGVGNRPTAAPTALSYSMSSRFATMGSTANGGFRVRHRELGPTLSTSSSAYVSKGTLNENPGLSSYLTWLPNIAKNYSEYVLVRLVYEWIPMCPSTTPGRLIMAHQNNPTDATPTTEASIMAIPNVSCDMWDHAQLIVDCREAMNPGPRKFVRSTATSSDLRTTDTGKLQLAITGGPTTQTTLGEVWINYEYEFIGPIDPTTGAGGASAARAISLSNANAQTFTTAVQDIVKFDTYDLGVLPDEFNTTALNTNGNGTDIVLPKGIWDVRIVADVSDNANEVMTAELGIYYAGASKFVGYNMRPATLGGSSVFAEALVNADGSSALNIKLKLTGAAGVLTLLASGARLFLRPV